MSSDQEIYDALSGGGAAKKSPCGCGESSTSTSEGGGGLAAELGGALDALGSETGDELFGVDDVSLENDLLFAGLEQEPSVTLQDLVSLAEQYPGLKITISF